MNEQRKSNETAEKPNGGALTLYHASSKGTGTALRLEPRFNRKPGDRYNCFFLEMAHQKTTASRAEGRRIPARFDWENKITVKLEFSDLCELLTVLEGRAAKAGGQRNGLYHENGTVNTIIGFAKNDSAPGYCLGLSRKTKEGEQVFRGRMVLSESEATGLRNILQYALFYITFHGRLGQEFTAGTEGWA